MEISKETYQQADEKTKQNMTFDLIFDLHECVKGNSKPGLIEDHKTTKEAINNKLAGVVASISWIRVFILGVLLAVVGVALK